MTLPQLSSSYCARHNATKPPLPYYVGQELVARSHSPPNPTSHRCEYRRKTAREREEIHPVERCFMHPPLPGHDGLEVVRLEIVQAIRLEDGYPAQLAVARILSCTPVKALLVAKLYDPLYFDHEQDDGDPFLWVEHQYTNESAAYITLKDLQGKSIPKYYGSYTLELPVEFQGQLRQRLVRLILIEWIPGSSMDKLEPKQFSKQERQRILEQIIDAESDMYAHNVRQRDMHLRNVMVSPDEGSLRVFLIDFGKVFFGRSIYARFPGEEAKQEEEKMLPGTRISPLLRWHETLHRHEVFIDWVDWDWQPWLEETYRETQESITGHMRKIWGPDNLTETGFPFHIA